MKITKHNNTGKYKLYIISLILFIYLSSNSLYSQDAFTPVSNIINSTQTSEHKPQSKVWYNGGYWWAVIPVAAAGADPAGTYLWRLDGNSLTKLIKLSDLTDTWADAKPIGNVTHILLQRGGNINSAELVSIEFVAGSPPSYQFWAVRPGNISITLDANLEVATIDIDSKERMWLASDGYKSINVRFSDSPYNSWSSPIRINNDHDTKTDDICAVTAFGGDKIGVLWSNQAEYEFQFRYHIDGDPPDAWSSLEIPVHASSPGTGVADDHINLAVGSDGTIYAAVKTSYNDGSSGNTTLALLVRRPSIVDSDNWESMHEVTNNNSTRPIALLNELENKIIVVYEGALAGGDIVYKYSSTNSISFGSQFIIDASNKFQDVTSTKQNITNGVLILYNLDGSDPLDANWYGMKVDNSPLPVELSSFSASIVKEGIKLNWVTETEVNNYGFEVERYALSAERKAWEKIGFVNGNGNSNSPKDYSFLDNSATNGSYSYRLKQIDNDGQFEYSKTIEVVLGTPKNFQLCQNYPNPFNPATTIQFNLPEAGNIKLTLYNILGQEIKTLFNEFKDSGIYTVDFNASDLNSGLYIYKLEAGSQVQTKMMTLIK